MNTHEAFKHLAEQRGWYKQAKIEPSIARSHKRFFKAGKLSVDMISKLLKNAGYKEIPSVWVKPSGKSE